MTTITAQDAARDLHAAGFPDSEIVTGVAIAWAESSFNADAVANEPDGSHSYGVWQINSVHGYAQLADGTWRDPKVNAQLAHSVWSGQGWNAWSTHKPTDPLGYARYQAALPVAVAAVTAALGASVAAAGTAGSAAGEATGVAGAATDALSGAYAIAKEPLSVLNFLEQPGTWNRIIKIAIGTALVIGAVYMLDQIQSAKVAAKVAPIVAKAV